MADEKAIQENGTQKKANCNDMNESIQVISAVSDSVIEPIVQESIYLDDICEQVRRDVFGFNFNENIVGSSPPSQNLHASPQSPQRHSRIPSVGFLSNPSSPIQPIISNSPQFVRKRQSSIRTISSVSFQSDEFDEFEEGCEEVFYDDSFKNTIEDLSVETMSIPTSARLEDIKSIVKHSLEEVFKSEKNDQLLGLGINSSRGILATIESKTLWARLSSPRTDTNKKTNSWEKSHTMKLVFEKLKIGSKKHAVHTYNNHERKNQQKERDNTADDSQKNIDKKLETIPSLNLAEILDGLYDNLESLTVHELRCHLDKLSTLTTQAGYQLYRSLDARDSALREKELYEGMVNDLVRHAERIQNKATNAAHLPKPPSYAIIIEDSNKL